jgi:hypothetical protein
MRPSVYSDMHASFLSLVVLCCGLSMAWGPVSCFFRISEDLANEGKGWIGWVSHLTQPAFVLLGINSNHWSWFVDSIQLCQGNRCAKLLLLEMELTCILSVVTFEFGLNKPSRQAWHNWASSLLINAWDLWGRPIEVGEWESFSLTSAVRGEGVCFDTCAGLRRLGGRDWQHVKESTQEMTSCMSGRF